MRTDGGDTYFPEIGRFSSLLPNDSVEIEVMPARGNKPKTSKVVGAQWSSSYRIVALVQRHRIRGKYGFLLFPVGVGLEDPIELVADNTATKHGEFVVVVVERFAEQPDSFRLVNIHKSLGSVRELANAVALSRFGLHATWSAEVKSEIGGMRDDIDQELLGERDDLRSIPFVTIDPASAKDHDDAVFSERLDDNTFRLMVAIADVSHYVRPKTHLDAEAQCRGTSIYLAEDVTPMLPEVLSNDICSLKYAQDRLALVCDMTITAEGIVTDYEFREAVINSRASLSYQAVERSLHSDDLSPTVRASLRCLFEVHRCLLKSRDERGTLQVDLPVSVLNISDSGEVESIGKSIRVESHSIIEEAMLAANVCAAEMIDKHYSGQAMYRVHAEPAKRDVEELNGILVDFGVKLPVDRKIRISDYDKIRTAVGHREDVFSALQIHILRSLSTAVYSAVCGPHFALSYQKYTHFTSPIRRYPDILVHRLIKSVLQGNKTKAGDLSLDRLATQCSYLERRADSCTRESEKWLKADYMKNCVDEVCDGVVVDIRSFGVFVQLDDPYVSGMIPIFKLGAEYFDYDNVKRQLVGEVSGTTYAIGMSLQVKVDDANPEYGFIDFEIAGSTWNRAIRSRRRRNRR